MILEPKKLSKIFSSSLGGLLVEAGTDEKRGFFLSNGKLLWIFLFFLISINQIDLCHTSNISSKGWFIHLFEKK